MDSMLFHEDCITLINNGSITNLRFYRIENYSEDAYDIFEKSSYRAIFIKMYRTIVSHLEKETIILK